jgi:hypothetical protein
VIGRISECIAGHYVYGVNVAVSLASGLTEYIYLLTLVGMSHVKITEVFSYEIVSQLQWPLHVI